MFYEGLFRTGVRLSPPPLDFARKSEVDRVVVPGLWDEERNVDYFTPFLLMIR